MYNAGDESRKNEMRRACVTYGGQDRCIESFSRKPGIVRLHV